MLVARNTLKSPLERGAPQGRGVFSGLISSIPEENPGSLAPSPLALSPVFGLFPKRFSEKSVFLGNAACVL